MLKRIVFYYVLLKFIDDVGEQLYKDLVVDKSTDPKVIQRHNDKVEEMYRRAVWKAERRREDWLVGADVEYTFGEDVTPEQALAEAARIKNAMAEGLARHEGKQDEKDKIMINKKPK